MTNSPRTPGMKQLRREAELLQYLIEHPPWKQVYEPFEVDTAIRAAFRRWAPADEFPSLLMIYAVWNRLSEQERSWLDSLPDDQRDDAVSRVARTLHLFALAGDEGLALASFGAACAYTPSKSKEPVVSNRRFARLVNAPPEDKLRLEALGRAFRHFRQKGIRVQRTDAENLLVFLFSEDPKAVVARWAGDYYRTVSDPTTAEASATELTV